MLLTIFFPILKHRKYLLIIISVTLIIFGLSYYLMMFSITNKSIIAYAQMNGEWYTAISFILSALISLFSGVYVVMWFLRRSFIRQRKEMAGTVLGTGGILGGVLVAGCPTCGAPLLALFGAPLALMSLPFRGLEVKVISLVLVFLSVYWLAENLYQQLSGTCKTVIENN